MLKDDASIQENAMILTAQEVDNARSSFVKEIEVFLEQALQEQANWGVLQYFGHLAKETAENVGTGAVVVGKGVGYTVAGAAVIVTLPVTLPLGYFVMKHGDISFGLRRDVEFR